MSLEPHYINPSLTDVRMANEVLARSMDEHTVEGSLQRKENNRVRCLACGHRCLLSAERRGVCRVRFHQNGTLRVPYGYVASLACDPIEKKPFFHVLPGSAALTFGMLGCDYHCDYCQNWLISQTLRDIGAGTNIRPMAATQVCLLARQYNAKLVVSSYNEPLITAEWAGAIFSKAQAAGLLCAMVSNGNATVEVLDFLQPWLSAFKVDLKCFRDQTYRSLGGTLERVTWTIQELIRRKIWIEVVTLVIPGFNDEEKELQDLAQFLVSVSPDIPWHVTAFHPDYRRTHRERTTTRKIMRAAELGRAAGLHYVYSGNVPEQSGEWENTLCPKCRFTLIERCGYRINNLLLEPPGRCPQCRTPIPGIWSF